MCEITGNYVGYLDFGGVRYWDYRDKRAHTPILDEPNPLPSNSNYRTDAIYLQTRPVEEAQAEKERLEDI